VTNYLIDPYNHTGYAQVLEETTGGVRTTYTIGDDVIAQYNATDGTEYLLYDGHGSTRQLIDNNVGEAINVLDNYCYDGYGVMLGGNPTPTDTSRTNLLYAGEQFDENLSQYYLRARYYDQNNGRFNRVDPFGGSMQDPQSLHKYLYAHCNPINNIDPSGKFTIVQVVITIAIIAVVFFVGRGIYHHKRRDYGEYIGPEISHWLANYMYHEANRASDQLGGLEGNCNSSAGLGYMREHGGTWGTSGLKTNPPTTFLKVFYNYLVCNSLRGKKFLRFIFHRQPFLKIVKINHPQYLRH